MKIFLGEQLPSLDSGIFEFKSIFERAFAFSNLSRRLLIRVKNILKRTKVMSLFKKVGGWL